MTAQIIGLIITMLFSAFFSGMEIAFVSSNRLRAEMDREKNGLSQRAIALFYQHPNNFVSTMLVGNNIALVIYGILFAQIFDATLFSGLADGVRVTADTLLSTLVVLFTGEFLPKTIFKSNPNTMLTIFAVPAWLCYVVLYPISRFATLLSKALLRIMGIHMNNKADDREFTKVDLDYLVQSSIENATDETEIDEEVPQRLSFTTKILTTSSATFTLPNCSVSTRNQGRARLIHRKEIAIPQRHRHPPLSTLS